MKLSIELTDKQLKLIQEALKDKKAESEKVLPSDTEEPMEDEDEEDEDEVEVEVEVAKKEEPAAIEGIDKEEAKKLIAKLTKILG